MYAILINAPKIPAETLFVSKEVSDIFDRLLCVTLVQAAFLTRLFLSNERNGTLL